MDKYKYFGPINVSFDGPTTEQHKHKKIQYWPVLRYPNFDRTQECRLEKKKEKLIQRL